MTRALSRSRVRAQETIALASPRPSSTVKFAASQSPPLSSAKGARAEREGATRDQGTSVVEEGSRGRDGSGGGAVVTGGALESVLQVTCVIYVDGQFDRICVRT